MRESGYYPPGAEFDPNAPWNQDFSKEYEGKVHIGYYIDKKDTFKTTYIREQDGKLCLAENISDIASYYEEDHHNPLSLIQAMAEQLQYAKENSSLFNKKTVDFLLKESQGWTITDKEIIDYEI